MAEAIIHFNMGQNYKEHKEQPKSFKLPDTNELIKVSLIVGIFSVLNGVIINEIKKSI
jgi:hypothetical protein